MLIYLTKPWRRDRGPRRTRFSRGGVRDRLACRAACNKRQRIPRAILAVWRVGAAATLKIEQPALEANSIRGTINPGVVVRRSKLKLRHSRCRRDCNDSLPRLRVIRSSFPHLRTGDVTLVSTTDEICFQRPYCKGSRC